MKAIYLEETYSMSVRKIHVYPDPVLRGTTEAVESFDERLKSILTDMWDTMYVFDGIGLAAPQIGLSEKIIVIDCHDEKHVLINPEIIEKEGSAVVEEGCLSFPGIYEKVEAPERLRVRYKDESGEQHEKDVAGFLACVFSHEIDHLNGRLLIDRVSPLKRQFLKKKISKKAAEAI